MTWPATVTKVKRGSPPHETSGDSNNHSCASCLVLVTVGSVASGEGGSEVVAAMTAVEVTLLVACYLATVVCALQLGGM